jgi:hypothetical protein
MTHKRSILPFLAAGFLAAACSLFGAAQSGVQKTNTQTAAGRTSSVVSTNQPSGSQDTSVSSLMKSFPVPPNSTMDSNSAESDEPDATSGSFIISSTSDIATVVSFYETELPKHGWTLRYADANTACGVTQYWKNKNIYLSLAFRYEETALTIDGQYLRVDAQSIGKYLQDFPLPERSELVDSSSTSWEFYILQDYKAVELFYRQKLLALQWTADATPVPVEASCGVENPADCEGGGGGSSCPSGVTPMPSPTFDSRKSITLLYTMPNNNEVELEIVPHGNATILYVNITLKGLDSAGLPADVPIYPGAVLQMVTPGTVEYQIDASLDTVKKYYEEQMKAAGWTPDGNAIEISGSYLQTWKKDNQKITVQIMSTGTGSMLILDCSTCR